MNNKTHHHLITIAVGQTEISIDFPEHLLHNPNFPLRGLALVCHPHPLMGGAKDNKVAQTLAKTMTQLGYVSVRPNFRGVGESAGVHDDGVGETDDMEQVVQWMQRSQSWEEIAGLRDHVWVQKAANLPLVLGGFSFGSFVTSNVAKRLQEQGRPMERLVLVGSAAGKWEMPPIAQGTIVIHGEKDDTIPLQDVFTWLKEQDTVVHVIPDADHFFHRKLHLIRDTIIGLWHGK